MLVSDVRTNDNGETIYTVTDNTGSTKSRQREFTAEELLNKWDKEGHSRLQRFTRYNFTNPETNEVIDGRDFLESGDLYSKKYIESRNELTQKEFTPAFDGKSKEVEDWIKSDIPKRFQRKASKFYEGLASEFSEKNIPVEHSKKLIQLGMAIMAHESGIGDNNTQRLRIKRNLPLLAKGYRKTKTGESNEIALSAGLSQIDPKWIDPDLREKYFPKFSENTDKNNNKIARQLFRDKELSGKLTQEILVRNYNRLADNPNLYGQDPDKFWFALAAYYQNPKAAFKVDKSGTPYIDNWDLDYSEDVFDHLPKTKLEYSENINNQLVNSKSKIAKMAKGGLFPQQNPNYSQESTNSGDINSIHGRLSTGYAMQAPPPEFIPFIIPKKPVQPVMYKPRPKETTEYIDVNKRKEQDIARTNSNPKEQWYNRIPPPISVADITYFWDPELVNEPNQQRGKYTSIKSSDDYTNDILPQHTFKTLEEGQEFVKKMKRLRRSYKAPIPTK